MPKKYRFPKTSSTVHTVIMYVLCFLLVIQYLSPLHICCVKKFCDRADLFGAMFGTCDSYQYKICIHLVCSGVCTRGFLTSLFTPNVAHSTRRSYRPRTSNQPHKKFLSLVVSWVKSSKIGSYFRK